MDRFRVEDGRMLMNQAQQALFLRQLGATLQSGIGFSRGLTLAAGSAPKAVRSRLSAVAQGLDRGESLTEALRRVQSDFSPWVLSILLMSEQSGAIALACRELSEILMDAHRRQGKIIVMTWRSLIIFWSLIMVVAMIFGVVDSPLSLAFWEFALLLAIGIAAIALVIAWSGKFRQIFYHLPQLYPIFQIQTFIHLTYVSLPLRCGILILAVVQWMNSQFPDPQLKKILQRAEVKIRQGLPMSQGLSGLVPPFITQLVRTSEETGNIDQAFTQIATYYQMEFDRLFVQLNVRIQFATTFAFAGFVLAVAVKVLMNLGQGLANLS